MDIILILCYKKYMVKVFYLLLIILIIENNYLFLAISAAILYFLYCFILMIDSLTNDRCNKINLSLNAYFILILILIFQSFERYGSYVIFILPFIFLPVLWAAVIKLIIKRFNIGIRKTMFLTALSGIVASGYFFVLSLIISFMPSEKLVPKWFYTPEIIRLKHYHEEYSHFPTFLPFNIKDYRFVQEHAFDGYNVNYLRFSTDKQYLDNIKQEYEWSCQIVTTNRKLINNFESIYINEINDDEDDVCILHKKTELEHYTTGIVFTKQNNTIFYFYKNF